MKEGRAENLFLSVGSMASGHDIVVRRLNASPHISGQYLWGHGEFFCDDSEQDAFWATQHNCPSLHHCGYIDCPFGATCTEFGSVDCASRVEYITSV